MECYFGSLALPNDNQLDKSAVVTFFIPEIGIKFKAPFDAVDSDHSDYASLLALLEFIDSNQKYFSNGAYQIFGNNLNIVNQVNLRQQTPHKFSHLLEKALTYRQKYRYSLDWVERDSNPTLDNRF